MKQISVANRYSLNIYEDKRLQYLQSKHLSRIAAIYKQKSNVSELERQQQMLLKNMHRSKEVSRHFKEREAKRNIEKSNKNLRKRILYHSCTKTLPAAIDNYTNELRTEKNYERKNREQEQIIKQNMKIQVALEQNMKSRKKYRKEAQKDIDNYLNLRDRISKLKIKKYNKVSLTNKEEQDAKASDKQHKNFRKKIKTHTSKSKSKGNESVHSIKQNA